MKYTFCEKLMWFALSGPSFKYLESQGKSVSKKKAKTIFCQMTARTPDIGSLIGNGGLPFIRKESVYNQFYSDLVTPLDDGISAPGTTVHCFYAAKMGERYLERYRKHFKDPVIHCFEMEHEELLVLHPELWAEAVHKCVAEA